MVDALRRVHRWLQPRGCVIDIHPTASRAVVDIDGLETGDIDAGDAPARHAAADAALATVVAERLFTIEHSEQFAFYTYGDSVAELRDYVEANWLSARIAEAVVRRTEEALRTAPGRRPRVREDVRLTKLFVARPVG